MAEALKFERLEDQAKRLGRVGAWAPGGYMNRCLKCGVCFEGDKRALNCLHCAVGALSAQATTLRDAMAREKLSETIANADYEPSMAQCDRCSGRGYHHGFGEDGADPDWCTVCGGAGEVIAPDALSYEQAIAGAIRASAGMGEG